MNDLERISHSIDELRQSLDGWDWNGFASTLAATLIGAAIAAGVSWLTLRRERTDRYRERMYSALTAIAPKINAWADLAITPQRGQVPFRRMSTLIDILSEQVLIEALANDEDRRSLGVWKEFFTAIDTISEEKDPPGLQERTVAFAGPLLEHLRDIVAGRKTPADVRSALNTSIASVRRFEIDAGRL